MSKQLLKLISYLRLILKVSSSWIKVCDDCTCRNWENYLTNDEVTLEECKTICKNYYGCEGVEYALRDDGATLCKECLNPEDYDSADDGPDDLMVSIYKSSILQLMVT